jgi:hypothetical protein
MKANPPKQPALAENSTPGSEVTRKKTRGRTGEPAASQGRSAPDATNLEPNEVMHPTAAESEGWDMVFGSTGHKVHVPSGDEEDDEGRSDPERLVERGVKDAGIEQRLEADHEAKENE